MTKVPARTKELTRAQRFERRRRRRQIFWETREQRTENAAPPQTPVPSPLRLLASRRGCPRLDKPRRQPTPFPSNGQRPEPLAVARPVSLCRAFAAVATAVYSANELPAAAKTTAELPTPEANEEHPPAFTDHDVLEVPVGPAPDPADIDPEILAIFQLLDDFECSESS